MAPELPLLLLSQHVDKVASYSPPHSKWKDAFCCPDSPRSAPFRAHFQSLSSGQTGPHPLQSPLLTLKWTWGPPSRWAAQLGGSRAWAQQWGLYLMALTAPCGHALHSPWGQGSTHWLYPGSHFTVSPVQVGWMTMGRGPQSKTGICFRSSGGRHQHFPPLCFVAVLFLLFGSSWLSFPVRNHLN